MLYLYCVELNHKLLIIGKVWPEPNSSAAGTRMMQLIEFYQSIGYAITFASTAKESEFQSDLRTLNIDVVSIELNASSFDLFVHDLQPEIVIFDRFMTEEQFGWRITEQCPSAMRILNTEDLHFLRRARQNSIKEVGDLTKVNLKSDDAIREVSSIYRCDLTLLVSDVELELLITEFQVPRSLLIHLPVFAKTYSGLVPTFQERDGFMFIGNFYHEPNWDALRFLKQTIWPKIRLALPKATLNVYGAYPSQKVKDFHNPKEGFLVHGRAENAIEVTIKSRVSLAPLRFGAGVKGKLLEAMISGTPSVTTLIGAEAMADAKEWSGVATDNVDDFVLGAISLYTDEVNWLKAQGIGYQIVKKRFDSDSYLYEFQTTLESILIKLEAHREKFFIQKMVQHQSLLSNRYLSKWIEEKNKN